MPLQLLIVGQATRAEALPLANWIREQLQPADTRWFASMDEALRSVAAATWVPDLIVVLQSHPDEYARHEIDQFQHVAPLARWVVCCGAWCESEGRNRDQWPLAIRVPMRSAMSRIRHEWNLLSGHTAESLPMSASREETFAIDHPELASPGDGKPILVDSPDPEYRRYLVELLTSAGYSGVNSAAVALIVLFDLDPREDRRQRLLALRDRYPDARFLGLMNLPNPHEVADLELETVLSKLGDQQRILDAIGSRE